MGELDATESMSGGYRLSQDAGIVIDPEPAAGAAVRPGASVARGRDPVSAPGGARAADAVGGLSFPDVPRLELDQLLAQLVNRAEDVMAAQERLRGLLRANALVASE